VISAEIAKGDFGPELMRSRQKPRFLPAGYGVISAEIAKGDFGQ
jgi:hypothetical protein